MNSWLGSFVSETVKSIFDNTGIHPESYDVAKALEKIRDSIDAKVFGCKSWV